MQFLQELFKELNNKVDSLSSSFKQDLDNKVEYLEEKMRDEISSLKDCISNKFDKTDTKIDSLKEDLNKAAIKIKEHDQNFKAIRFLLTTFLAGLGGLMAWVLSIIH